MKRQQSTFARTQVKLLELLEIDRRTVQSIAEPGHKAADDCDLVDLDENDLK